MAENAHEEEAPSRAQEEALIASDASRMPDTPFLSGDAPTYWTWHDTASTGQGGASMDDVTGIETFQAVKRAAIAQDARLWWVRGVLSVLAPERHTTALPYREMLTTLQALLPAELARVDAEGEATWPK
jgi:hypothetical protein